jgi:hypothetical protein
MDYTFILRLLAKAVGVLAADRSATLSFRISLYRGKEAMLVENQRSRNFSVARIARPIITCLPSVLPFEASLHASGGLHRYEPT